MSLLIFLILLVVLIVVHEFGHFIVAKLFGIRVDEFSVFFPPRIFKKKWGETLYSLGSLPFGGFVKIYGESGETNDPRSFTRKNRTIQVAVVAAGVVFNLLFAWALLSVGYMVGLQSLVQHEGVGEVRDAKPTVIGLLPNSPAEAVGIKAGDVVLSLETGSASREILRADDVSNFIRAHQEESIVLHLSRNGQKVDFIAKAKEGLAPDKKVVGIETGDVGILQLPIHLALYQAALITKTMVVESARGLWMLASQAVSGALDLNNVAGPIGIASIGSSAVKSGFGEAVALVAFISVNLAVINMIPIPGLDGGRALIIIIEGIVRRPLPKLFVTGATIAGFVLLILLMIAVSFHDVHRLIQ